MGASPFEIYAIIIIGFSSAFLSFCGNLIISIRVFRNKLVAYWSFLDLFFCFGGLLTWLARDSTVCDFQVIAHAQIKNVLYPPHSLSPFFVPSHPSTPLFFSA